MERGEEWRCNPVDGAGITHVGIHGHVGVDVGLAVGVHWKGWMGLLERGLVLSDGVEWRAVMLLDVVPGDGWLGHVVWRRRGRAPGLEGSVGGGRALLELALV